MASDDTPSSEAPSSKAPIDEMPSNGTPSSKASSSETSSPNAADPLDEAARTVAALGAHARPLREVIALLTEEPHTLASLIRRSALSRRTVETLVAAIEPDLISEDEGMRLRPERVAAYRERFDYQQLRSSRLVDPLAAAVAEHPALVADLDRLIHTAPRARQSFDHVSATPETAVRRALWLDATFDLREARLLCVGDHDLTSLAVAQVNPGVAITVVDVDERILEFIDTEARARGFTIRCLHADFRFGLPSAATGWADLLFTDPPYTPDGVRLFLHRGLTGLRDREHGRLVMAYGFGERQPTLGLKVQQAVQDLHLVHEAILPHFNRYFGAQAVGSASDLYVSRPTSRTWATLDAREPSLNIYTHGAQSLEGAHAGPPAHAVDALCTAAAGPDELPIAVITDGGKPARANIGHVRLGTLFSTGLPAAISRQGRFAVAVDLSADPGPWLLRALLAVNAERVVLLVPNQHADLANESAQLALTKLVAEKYALRFRRSTPDSRHALVEATLLPAPTEPGPRLTRFLLDRAHGKIGNVWRDGVVRLHKDSATPLSKNQARERIQHAVRRPDLLEGTLFDLPRHQFAALFAEATASLGSEPPGR